MGFTKVSSGGISTSQTFVFSNVDAVGVVTASTVQVGSATTIHTTGIDLGGGTLTSHNINSTGVITATSLTVTNDVQVGGALTITGNLTVNGTTTTIDTIVTAVDSLAIDGDASVGGALTATGNISANSFYGDGSNLTGIGVTRTFTIGTRTTAQEINLVGAGITLSLRSGIGTLNF